MADVSVDLLVDDAQVTPANPVPVADDDVLAQLVAAVASLGDVVSALAGTLTVTTAGGAAAADATVVAVTAAVEALPAQIDALTETQLRTVVPDETGTWAYAAGTAGSITPTGRVLAITATAPDDGDANLTINAGDTVTIPAGRSLTIVPRANLTSPALVFTGTDAYFVHLVT